WQLASREKDLMTLIWMIFLAAFLGSGVPAQATAVTGDSLLQGAQNATDARCPFTSPGLVVEAVAPESPGFRVGLKPGDRLLSWCLSSSGKGGCIARGELRTPFDWRYFERDEVQRGGVVVEGSRGSENFRWNLLPASQGLTVAPLLHGPIANAYQGSRDRERAGDPAAAA